MTGSADNHPMQRIVGVAYSVAALAIVACGAAPPLVQAKAPPAAVDAYPLSLPVIDDDELARQSAELMAKTPGWTIVLDSFGILAFAHCDICAKSKPRDFAMTAEEREKIDAFISVHRHFLGLDAPGVVAKADKMGGVFFQQVTPWSVIGSVRGGRTSGVVAVSGKMWSGVPAAGSWRPDPELEAKLRALDPSPDLEIQHRYQKIERTEHGPLELHEAVCLFTPVDSMPIFRAPDGKGPSRPCVDARTGEDLTPYAVSWKVQATNGRVTSRSIERVRSTNE